MRSVHPRRWRELRSVACRSSSAGVLVRCCRRSDSRSDEDGEVEAGWLGEEEGIVGLEGWGRLRCCKWLSRGDDRWARREVG